MAEAVTVVSTTEPGRSNAFPRLFECRGSTMRSEIPETDSVAPGLFTWGVRALGAGARLRAALHRVPGGRGAPWA